MFGLLLLWLTFQYSGYIQSVLSNRDFVITRIVGPGMKRKFEGKKKKKKIAYAYSDEMILQYIVGAFAVSWRILIMKLKSLWNLSLCDIDHNTKL